MALTTYRRKRVFSRTAEPKGDKRKKSVKSMFVVHKHAARRLHYDLRLEIDGVLKSWAVPKGPSLVPFEKRLAVNVEDHPMEYIEFEGNIPEGEYGAGEMIIWDRGKWQPLDDPLKAYQKGTIKFLLMGKKLKGKWTLVRMKDGKNWLLFKDSDEFSSDEDILAKEPGSVTSGARIAGMDTIAPGYKKQKKGGKASKNFLDASQLSNAVKEAMPDELKPQMAASFEKPPKGESWIYEIKYDGYRILCFINHGKVKLITRNGYDWTSKFKSLALDCAKLPIESGILDGEITVPDERGISNFQLLQNALRDGAMDQLQYFVFDIPYFNGYNLKASPLAERKNLLQKIMDYNTNPQIIYSQFLTGYQGEVLKSACRLGL
jgi:bifunctional non-homologous end joining protein LigD